MASRAGGGYARTPSAGSVALVEQEVAALATTPEVRLPIRPLRELLRLGSEPPRDDTDPTAVARWEAAVLRIADDMQSARQTPLPDDHDGARGAVVARPRDTPGSASTQDGQAAAEVGPATAAVVALLRYARDDPGWRQCVYPAAREMLDHFWLRSDSVGTSSARLRVYRPPPPPAEPESDPAHFVMGETTRLTMGLVGDLGANGSRFQTETLRAMATALQDAPPHTPVVHLGDIYYTGTSDECERFLEAFHAVFPDPALRTLWAVPGNHEYLSAGSGFFGVLVRGTPDSAGGGRQHHSFFCHEYPQLRLLVLGLDTGLNSWPDSRTDDLDLHAVLHPAEAAWARGKLKLAVARGYGVVVFSHHPLVSAFAKPPQFQRALADQLLAGHDCPIRAWCWGHEHRLLVYDVAAFSDTVIPPEYKRRLGCLVCLGHGSVPTGPEQYEDAQLPGVFDRGLVPPLRAVPGAPTRRYHGHGFAVLTAGDPLKLELALYSSETAQPVRTLRL